MTTIRIIIFSFNRAMQLDALLNSLVSYWERPCFDVHVLYRASSISFQNGYERLKGLYSSVCFHQEKAVSRKWYSLHELTDFYNLKLLYLCPHLRGHKSDFRQQLLSILKQEGADTVMFLTDDAIFIRPIILSPSDLFWLSEAPTRRQLSLRHGQELIEGSHPKSTADGYEWWFGDPHNNSHWSYRFSLDGHIYDRKTIIKVLKCASFSNPNTLESGGLLHFCHRNLLTECRCGKNVCLLSYPINIVQNTFSNEALDVCPSILNDYYLKGYSIQYPTVENISSFQIYPDYIILRRDNEKIVFQTRAETSKKVSPQE